MSTVYFVQFFSNGVTLVCTVSRRSISQQDTTDPIRRKYVWYTAGDKTSGHRPIQAGGSQ